MHDLKDSIKWKRLWEGIVIAFTMCYFLNLQTSDFIYVLFVGLYIIVANQQVVLELHENRVKNILACFFSVCMVMGNIETILNIDAICPWMIRVLICLYGFYLCFSLLLKHSLFFIRNIKMCDISVKCMNKQHNFCFMCAFLSLVLVWSFGLAISYPANTTSDSNAIINMALGNKEMWAAVPIVYVLSIRYLWNLGFTLFGTVNAGLAVCAFAHVIMLALIVAYLVSRLYKCNVKKSVCVIVWAFYAIVPYNVQFSHTIWKDIPFSACVFLLVILVWEYCIEVKEKSKFHEYAKLLFLIISAIGMCLMRNNGLFAYIFFLPFGIALFWRKNKKVVLSLIVAFVLVRIIQGPVYDNIMSANNTQVRMRQSENETEDVKESSDAVVKVQNATDAYNASGIYIITTQQFARVAVNRMDLSEEDYQRLNNIVNIEKVQTEYNPYNRDSAAKCINYKISTKDYLKEWVYFGCKYPVDFFLAWKDQTFGYWYPDVQYWVYTDQIRENDIGLYKDSVLSDEIRRVWLRAEELYKDIPIYGLLWSIGFIVWATFLSMGVTYIRKGLKALLPYIPIIGVWVTLLVATPVYAEFRYIYPVFLCVPLSVLIPFIEEQKER